MKINIIKQIADNNNKTFKVGDDIHFTLIRNDKFYSCFGIIKDIKEEGFVIENVEVDKMRVSDSLYSVGWCFKHNFFIKNPMKDE